MRETHPSSERLADCRDSNRVKTCLRLLISLGGAANERVTRFKETPQQAHLTRNTDAHTCANMRSLPNRSPKPKWTIGTQINPVQALVDFECGRKPSRTSRQICELVGFAESFHQIDSIKRLNGAQQDSRANSRFFRRHVEHVGRPIDEVHIREPCAQEQRLVSGRSSAIGMTTRIARWVSFCFDNATANPVSPGRPHDRFPDEVSGQLTGFTWQARP